MGGWYVSNPLKYSKQEADPHIIHNPVFFLDFGICFLEFPPQPFTFAVPKIRVKNAYNSTVST
jgi:hypothetical protein